MTQISLDAPTFLSRLPERVRGRLVALLDSLKANLAWNPR